MHSCFISVMHSDIVGVNAILLDAVLYIVDSLC